MPGTHPDVVNICNRALSLIEHNARFSDFEDGSEEAEVAALHYDSARRLVLGKVRWHFAQGFRTLDATLDAASSGAAPAALPNVFLLPPEVIAVRTLPDYPGARWSVGAEDNRLYTAAAAPLVIDATVDVADPTRFEPDFVALLELYLAARFAPRFSRSQNRAELLMDRFEKAASDAAENDAQEGGDFSWDGREDADWRDVVERPYPDLFQFRGS